MADFTVPIADIQFDIGSCDKAAKRVVLDQPLYVWHNSFSTGSVYSGLDLAQFDWPALGRAFIDSQVKGFAADSSVVDEVDLQ